MYLVKMKAKDIIKEIDPDYMRCMLCERLRHKSQLKYYPDNMNLFVCTSYSSCQRVRLKDKIRNNDKYWRRGDNYINFSSVLENGLLLTYLFYKVKYYLKRMFRWRRDKV